MAAEAAAELLADVGSSDDALTSASGDGDINKRSVIVTAIGNTPEETGVITGSRKFVERLYCFLTVSVLPAFATRRIMTIIPFEWHLGLASCDIYFTYHRVFVHVSGLINPLLHFTRHLFPLPSGPQLVGSGDSDNGNNKAEVKSSDPLVTLASVAAKRGDDTIEGRCTCHYTAAFICSQIHLIPYSIRPCFRLHVWGSPCVWFSLFLCTIKPRL